MYVYVPDMLEVSCYCGWGFFPRRWDYLELVHADGVRAKRMRMSREEPVYRVPSCSQATRDQPDQHQRQQERCQIQRLRTGARLTCLLDRLQLSTVKRSLLNIALWLNNRRLMGHFIGTSREETVKGQQTSLPPVRHQYPWPNMLRNPAPFPVRLSSWLPPRAGSRSASSSGLGFRAKAHTSRNWV